MERTSLTIGGFTQPGVARTIIEPHSSSERGFCQRFLWIFPKPIFGHLETLSGNQPELCQLLGEKRGHRSAYKYIHTHDKKYES